MGEEEDDGPELDPRVLGVPELLPGDRCRVNVGQADRPNSSTSSVDPTKSDKGETKERLAVIKFVGQVPSMPKGYWVGVQYDEKVGKNDGMLNGRRYFRCPAGHGGFVRATKLVRLDQPAGDAGHAAEQSASTAGGRRGGRVDPAAVAVHEPAPDAADAASDSMASRIAKRRQEIASQRSQRSPLSGRSRKSMNHLTLEEWQERVAPEREPERATPDNCLATGPELEKAVVGTLAQFTILARNAGGEQVTKGGDNFEVCAPCLQAPPPLPPHLYTPT